MASWHGCATRHRCDWKWLDPPKWHSDRENKFLNHEVKLEGFGYLGIQPSLRHLTRPVYNVPLKLMPMHLIHLGWSNTWFTVPYDRFIQLDPLCCVSSFIRCQMKGEKAGQHLELTLSTLAFHTWWQPMPGVVNKKSGSQVELPVLWFDGICWILLAPFHTRLP